MHNYLGVVLVDAGRPQDTEKSFRRAIRWKSAFPEAHNNLGNVLMDLGRLEDAAASIKEAIAVDRNHHEAHNNLGDVLCDLGRYDEAAESYRDAIRIKPDFTMAHNNLGLMLLKTGRLDDAAASFRKVIDITPDYAAAHRHLAHINKHASRDDDIRKIEDLFSSSKADDDEKKHLAFALGKSFEDLRQYEKAFEFFVAGNSINRSMFHYDTEEWSAYVRMLKAVFNDAFFASPRAGGCADQTPIFIVGMLRSGTTPVEQILASHPNVYGAGELDTLSTTLAASLDMGNFPKDIQNTEGEDFTRFGEEYIHAIRGKSGSARFITDKMPGNFKYIGMIKRMLPNAKIIHCKRSSKDNCLSIFKNYFPGDGHRYAYDMNELGRYYKTYRELMKHWHGVLPGHIHDIRYEELVADQEGQTRALLAHRDLEWDEACLQFHKTDRPVRTLSTAQMRRPIYTDSVQIWKQYEKQLAPLIKSLR